jgi:DNA modification methylase
MISTTASGEGPVYNMDCRDYLASRESGVKAIFMDPPDNLGLGYGTYVDRVQDSQYYGWLESLVVGAMERARVVWISYYHKHDLKISSFLERILRERYASWAYRKILWRFTFGQYVDTQIGSGYRPIVLLTSHGTQLYYDANRVVSERMLLGDPRASGFRIPDDVWEIPRVTGNSAERRKWHPTQHPEELMERIVRLSVKGQEKFVDLFGGTGTSLRVGRRIGLDCRVVELDASYCRHIANGD